MTERYRIGFIGLGSIGQRMLRNAAIHDRVAPAVAWDPQDQRLAAAAAAHDGLRAAADAAALIDDAAIDLVYIASPPLSHAAHARAALDAGKAVLCEKPLGIDLAASRDLVAHAQKSALPNAVNFIYASAQAASALSQALQRGELGDVYGVEVQLHLPHWAETRFAEAPWLRASDQGGFVREVLSHYVYLTEKLFGPASLRYAQTRAPDDGGQAVSHLIAELDCDGLPVFIQGTTLGAGADVLDFTVWGERRSYRVRDLYKLQRSDGDDWHDAFDPGADPPADVYRRQYDNVAAMLDGAPHGMPDFAAGLSVQTLIEAMLDR